MSTVYLYKDREAGGGNNQKCNECYEHVKTNTSGEQNKLNPLVLTQISLFSGYAPKPFPDLSLFTVAPLITQTYSNIAGAGVASTVTIS